MFITEASRVSMKIDKSHLCSAKSTVCSVHICRSSDAEDRQPRGGVHCECFFEVRGIARGSQAFAKLVQLRLADTTQLRVKPCKKASCLSSNVSQIFTISPGWPWIKICVCLPCSYVPQCKQLSEQHWHHQSPCWAISKADELTVSSW